MRRTFECNESMIITIPIGNLKDAGAGQLMPEKFICMFRDSYKVFVCNGKPKPLGAAQAMTGLLLCTIGLVVFDWNTVVYTLPSALFVVSGLLSYAAGTAPHMNLVKLSFSLNILSFFWSIAAFSISMIHFHSLSTYKQNHVKMHQGVTGLIMSLLVVENITALFLIYWLSKAVCRQQFNTLPIIRLKQGD
ncbi:membrane-spanning 4-domains subfamily A member 4A [Solea senegalensis]|nr:membrane-spanning 4-domains subfamily A member 4D isoform X1 [Solea senegalensis]KAG7474133.1 membrane-spanning 4-domains subfamily A member 4A [Solea senegalensis]